MEVQKEHMTCPTSHSRCVAETEFKPQSEVSQETSSRLNTRFSLDSYSEPKFLDFSLIPFPYQVQAEIMKQQ